MNQNLVSSQAEAARVRIMYLLADARQSTPFSLARQEHTGRLKPGPSATELGLVAPGTAISLMVAIVESFALDALEDLVDLYVRSSPRFVNEDWKEHQWRLAEQSWSAWKDAWSDWFEIDLLSAPTYAAVRAFTEARNALLHGVGRLTRRQLATKGGRRTMNELSSIGIDVVEGRIQLDNGHVEACAAASAEFVSWLDNRVSNHALNYPTID